MLTFTFFAVMEICFSPDNIVTSSLLDKVNVSPYSPSDHEIQLFVFSVPAATPVDNCAIIK